MALRTVLAVQADNPMEGCENAKGGPKAAPESEIMPGFYSAAFNVGVEDCGAFTQMPGAPWVNPHRL